MKIYRKISKNSLIILVTILLVLLAGVSYFLFSKNNPSKLFPSNSKSQPEQNCTFEIKEVHFEETKDFQSPLIKIKGVVGPVGFYKYKIHFPPQEKARQGIGPLEGGKKTPCTDEKMCKPTNPCQEFNIQDFITRSYPENIPEFGVNYFAKISFYLNDNTEKNWEGEIAWEKIEASEGQEPEQKEKKETEPTAPTGPQTTGTGQAVVSFPARPTLPSWEEELQSEWVPSFEAGVVWGYRVLVNDHFYGDFPAVYTPKGTNTYTLTDPQSLTISNLSPGTYYVKVFPLAMFFSPNLVTTDGRRYAFKKTGPTTFLWAWVDNKGNPISPWSPLSEIPQGYGMTYPGYYLVNRTVFSDYIQVKKSSGGGGGGGGLVE